MILFFVVISLCERLGIKAKKRVFPFVGGNYPQKFVNSAAAAIACRESRAVLITGGEAEYAVRRAKRGEVKLDWPAEEEVGKYDGGNALGTSDFENTYNLLLPIGIYVFFETILKEISGRTWEEHNAYIGSILKRFSAVAGENPLAWSGENYTCKEIITPSEKNRYLCYCG